MKKIAIPENLTGKGLYKFLIDNKSEIMARKKAIIKETDPISISPTYYVTKDGALKTATTLAEIPLDATVIKVKAVGNTLMYMDSHDDVLITGSYKKTLKEQKDDFYHLVDHNYSMVDGDVGDVQKMYIATISWKELGVNKDGDAEVLVMESDVRKDYNVKVFEKYSKGKVKQHSVGIYYIKLALAINDKDYPNEYEVWKKHIDDIINSDVVKKRGYFWAIYEVKLVEVSAVRLGANDLTPTLSVEESKEEDDDVTRKEQPSGSTDTEASEPTPVKNRFKSIGAK